MPAKQRSFKGGPEIFIQGPYVRCPKCKKETFGVLSIQDKSYLRRCNSCYYPKGTEPAARFPLPELSKKIIYLDQMAISNMMKAINPETKAHRRGSLDAFWRSLFERLDILCKLQVAICPASESHKHESLLSPFFEAAKRMYQHLSGGITFRYHEEIYRFEATIQFKRWMGESHSDLTINEVTMGGKINAWQDRYMITLKLWDDENLIKELKTNREKIQEGMDRVFKLWQSQKDREFDYWYEEESKAAAEVLVHSYSQHLKLFEGIQSGLRLPDMEVFSPPMVETLFFDLKRRLESHGFEGNDAWKQLLEFLNSDTFRETPFIRISSMLYAALARKAAKGGQKEPPNRGFHVDVNTVASVLPFCDAIFVDNQIRALLAENPVADRLTKYGTKVFSSQTKNQFLEYLDDVTDSVSEEHLGAVRQVYGPTWVKPYTEMYRP